VIDRPIIFLPVGGTCLRAILPSSATLALPHARRIPNPSQELAIVRGISANVYSQLFNGAAVAALVPI